MAKRAGWVGFGLGASQMGHGLKTGLGQLGSGSGQVRLIGLRVKTGSGQSRFGSGRVGSG